MGSVAFLILARMRAPLLVLIAAYAVAVLGLVLIPGTDDAGNAFRMDFLHAFYVVSYTATTIGFGELPYAFNPAQRLWMTASLYLLVVAWFYALGTIVALVQDAALRQALAQARFEARVRRLHQPFVLLCGCGDAGLILLRELSAEGEAVVVLDRDEQRIGRLEVEDFASPVLLWCADAGVPANLRSAGLELPSCRAVVALADEDAVNLHVAITAKLLNRRLLVCARADYAETAANMASFGTDRVLQPFELFADRLLLAMERPCLALLEHWLVHGGLLSEPLQPPLGRWLLCSYGRFGQTVHRRFRSADLETVLLEHRPEQLEALPEDLPLVKGWGTEAKDLLAAGVEQAVGIVAGTADDTNNLSILMTARALNPALFAIARQNHEGNRELFDAVGAQLFARSSSTLARRALLILQTPLLLQFLSELEDAPPALAREVLVRLAALFGERAPRVLVRRLSLQRAADRRFLRRWVRRLEARSVPALCLFVRLRSSASDAKDRVLALPSSGVLHSALRQHDQHLELLLAVRRRD